MQTECHHWHEAMGEISSVDHRMVEPQKMAQLFGEPFDAQRVYPMDERIIRKPQRRDSRTIFVGLVAEME
jgi:hypothetical protein